MTGHPTIRAAVDAVVASELPYNPDAATGATRELYTRKAQVAVAAAFRERAAYLKYTYGGLPVSRLLTRWADEIEGATDG